MTITARPDKTLFVLLLAFSFSLALSKSAANIVMTLTYLAAVLFAIRFRDFRTALASNLNQPLVLPMLLYLAMAGIGVLYTEHIKDGLGILNKAAGLLFVYWMTSALVETSWRGGEKHRFSENLILTFIAGIFVLDIIGLMTFGGIIGNRKLSLPLFPMHVHHIWFGNMNALGIYAACSFLLFGGLPRHSRKRTLLIAFILLAILSTLLSTSRTAWLGMIVTGTIMAYVYSPRKHLFYAGLGIAAACCVLAYLFVPLVHDRINSGFADISQYASGNRETSMGWRFLMWKAALSMFQSNPVFGVGTGDYVITMERFIGSGAYPESLLQFNQPHNMYLFALATNGLLGLSTLLYLFYRVFTASLAGRSNTDSQWQSFLASSVAVHFLMAGLTDSLFNIFILRYAFAFLMGVSVRNSFVSPAKSR